MTGDHHDADIAGARAAGLRGIWIDHGTWPGQEHGPTTWSATSWTASPSWPPPATDLIAKVYSGLM
ncbi:hypothetical protein GCM10020220_063210 [Nonomuraea rubra]|uniref:HAD hydrolase-like protein n=1 Tax=Nonomuraea rubra TaxID=46180 RepID=UPI0031E985A4